MISVNFVGAKHVDDSSYYIRCNIVNDLGSSAIYFALDAKLHSNDNNIKYLVSRLNAMIADVARHAREDAQADMLNSVGLRMAMDSNKRANAAADDPLASVANTMRAINNENNRRADIRALVSAEISRADTRRTVDDYVDRGIALADAIARKIGVAVDDNDFESDTPPATPFGYCEVTFEQRDKWKAIEAAAISWKAAVNAYSDIPTEPAINRVTNASDALRALLP